MQISINIDTNEGGQYEANVLRALAGEQQAATEARQDHPDLHARRLLEVVDDIRHNGGSVQYGNILIQRCNEYGTPESQQPQQGVVEQADEAEEVDEDDDPQQVGDTSGLPRHPDGRIVGRAPEGKKRRTKAQIAEDEAWEAAQNTDEAARTASAGVAQLADGGQEQPQQPAQQPQAAPAPQEAPQAPVAQEPPAQAPQQGQQPAAPDQAQGGFSGFNF